MKATFKILLVLALVLAMVMGLVACGSSPLLELSEAVDNLKAEDYYVQYHTRKSDLEPGMAEMLEAESDEEEITIIIFRDSSTAKAYFEIKEKEREVQITLLESELEYLEQKLEYFEADMDAEELEDIDEQIEEIKQSLLDYEEKYVLDRSGEAVWFGTKNAVEDTKGY